jgi:hypothetical protein
VLSAVAIETRDALQDLLSRRFVREAGELALVALAFLLYFIVRGQAVDRPDLALAHAQQVLDLERDLGLFVEADWQRSILGSIW